MPVLLPTPAPTPKIPEILFHPANAPRLLKILDRKIAALEANAQLAAAEIEAENLRTAALKDEKQRAITRAKCKTLYGFVQEAWKVLEPETPFVPGWHIQAICDHLEAISHGKITRLVINIPPGCMKSLTASVLWEAWEWGPLGRPGLRYLTTSYKEDYAKRDARKMRDLIRSDWYQAHWPITLLREGEMSFENSHRGGREAVPFGSLTAGRGNRLVIDDPHSTETAESQADRITATRIFRESATSRLNDPRTDAIVVIMHRLHPDDICGVIDKLGLGYEKLILPMEFEIERRCKTSIFTDPRKHDGDLLFPERFTRKVIDRDKVALGSYAYAGQYQQRPAPREGGMFKLQWMQVTKFVPPPSAMRVRRWDLAATLPKPGTDPDWSVGLRMSKWDGKWYIEHVARFRDSAGGVRRKMRALAEADGEECRIALPQDPGQAGKDQAENLVAFLAPYIASAERETGAKDIRAEPLAAQFEAGNVLICEGPWNETFIEELCSFPVGHDDQVDAASGAFLELTGEGIPTVVLDMESLRRETWRVPGINEQ